MLRNIICVLNWQKYILVNKKIARQGGSLRRAQRNYVNYSIAGKEGKVKWQDREEERKNILFGMGNGTKTAER